MGKSVRSCFDIITCTRDSVDYDDLELSEFQASLDKRRTFRKQSALNHVLSKSVISEPPVIVNNQESPDARQFTFSLPEDSFPTHKISSPKKVDDMLHCSLSMVDSKVGDISHAIEETKPDSGLKVSAVISIQAAIRGYLARKGTKKLKCVIKLQAAVRGHLIRRQAAETLRCVLAIVKMQALVQVRFVYRPVENLANQRKVDALDEIVSERMNPLESHGTKHKKTYSSTEELLTNGFTRKLLESTTKTKHIHIDCDPSRSDSAWKWLERWMTLASKDNGQQQELNLARIYQDQRKNTKHGVSELANEIPVAVGSVTVNSESASVLPVHSEQLISNCATDLDFQAPTSIMNECLSPRIREHQWHNQPRNGTLDVAQKNSTKNETIKERSSFDSSEVIFQSASVSGSPDTSSSKLEFEKENLNYVENGVKCESLEAEGKNSTMDIRKVCNPAFVAAQSKFKELYLVDSGKSASTSYQDVSVGSRPAISLLDNFADDNISVTEDSASHVQRVPTATSECGTELSVSSTLDSPDRSNAEGGEIVLELGPVDPRDFDVNGGFGDASENLNLETRTMSDPQILQPPMLEMVNGSTTDLMAAADSVRREQEPSLEQHQAQSILSDVQVHPENAIDQEAHMFSLGGSSIGSHKSSIESREISSSQISLNNKKSNKENNMHVRNQRSQSVGKRSLFNLSNDSGGRSSTENLSKSLMDGERRNSFGIPELDHADHEPRTSISNSLPGYMQTTESARAKVHANNSPKLSPEVHDDDSYPRKRNLSSSPCMQQSPSQIQQNAKGSMPRSSHNYAERKWRR